MYYFYDETMEIYPDFPHYIIPSSSNQENMFQLKKLAMLTDEVRLWLDENIKPSNWRFNDLHGVLMFLTKEDAMAFMLRWS